MGTWVERLWIPNVDSGVSRAAKRSGTYRAFVPDKLHDLDVRLPVELSTTVARVERDIRDLCAPLATESHGILGFESVARFLLRSEAISSSRIEGLAPRSDKVALAEYSQEAHDEEIRGITSQAEAVARNVRILRAVVAEVGDQELTLELVDKLQAQLISGSDASKRLIGIRKQQNWIGGSNYNPFDAQFVPPPAEDVRDLLDDLLAYANGAQHAGLVQAAITHAQFETIHPYPDGNGRVGRALIHYILQRRGLTTGPVLPVSMVLAALSDAYVEALTAFRNGQVIAWVEFFVSAAKVAVDEANRLRRSVSDVQAQWNAHVEADRESRGLRRVLRVDSAEYRILDALVAHPVLTVKSVQQHLDIRSATSARTALDSLAELGILRKKSVGKGGVYGYFADDVFDLINSAESRLAESRLPETQLPPSAAFD